MPIIDCGLTMAELLETLKQEVRDAMAEEPKSWKLEVYITGTQAEAEYIREEVVGACEDAQESQRITSSIGDLEPDES
jgi:hypothetical protein